jgi:hypothetical protein
LKKKSRKILTFRNLLFFSFSLILLFSSMGLKSSGLLSNLKNPIGKKIVPSSEGTSYECEWAICTIFRNEAPFLKEWIEFHKLVGCQRFYLYNNGSTDNYETVLQPYIDSGEVELIDWPFVDETHQGFCFTVQPKSYEDCIARTAGKVKWLAIIDSDEFLTPIQDEPVVEVFKRYEEYPALFVNWQMFGTSGVLFIPENKLTIELFVMKSDLDLMQTKNGKSIVRPEFVARIKNPHHVELQPGYAYIDMQKQPIKDFNNVGPHYQELVLNHYWCRAEKNCYQDKFEQYLRWHSTLNLSCLRFHTGIELNQVIDHTMDRFVEPLREKMGYSTGASDEKDF